MSVGAVICIYEDSGFLAESVQRIYPLMDRVFILIDTMPWNGPSEPERPTHTYATALGLPDPDHKIEIVSRYWKTEADQRNYGMTLLHDRGLEWCFLVDEDELYNTFQLKAFLQTADPEKFAVYLFSHQMYWKDRNTVLDLKDGVILSALLNTAPGRVVFTEARAVTVYEGRKWESVNPDLIVCHHMSYVRTDEQMLRKISTFSHANDIVKGWYENVWLKWEEGMPDLHPLNPPSFRGTIPASKAKYPLEAT